MVREMPQILRSLDINEYHPYGLIPSVDYPQLQVELEKVFGWTVPVHHGGCSLQRVVPDATAGIVPLDLLFRCETDELEKWGNITFRTGNLIEFRISNGYESFSRKPIFEVLSSMRGISIIYAKLNNLNIGIRLALSHRLLLDEGNEEQAAIELAKSTVHHAGSIQSEVIGPILQSYMPDAIHRMTYPPIQVLMGLGNRMRNLGYPDYAEKQCYRQAQYIIDKKIRVLNPKARAVDALDRRIMTVAKRVESKNVEKVIDNARDHNDPYGFLTALHNVGYYYLRNKEYAPAEEKFRVMLSYTQNPNAIVSWWHKMAGWLGMGATLYASDQSKYDKALGYCLKAEYVSAMLGLRVDVTRGISEQLLGHGTLLSPSAFVRKIGQESNVAKEEIEEIRHDELIKSGLQKDLLTELSGISLGVAA
jgi:hypothetical protein